MTCFTVIPIISRLVDFLILIVPSPVFGGLFIRYARDMFLADRRDFTPMNNAVNRKHHLVRYPQRTPHIFTELSRPERSDK